MTILGLQSALHISSPLILTKILSNRCYYYYLFFLFFLQMINERKLREVACPQSPASEESEVGF